MTNMNLGEIEANIRAADMEALEAYRSGKTDAPILYKAIGHTQKASSEDGQGKPMIFVASEETPDRMGDIITVEGWDTKSFEQNPVFLFAHDHSIPPIGVVPRIWKEGKQLLSTVQWDDGDDFAKLVRGKYERGIMRAVSVGFRPLEFKENDGGKGLHFLKQELLEISAVPVPMHPSALQKSMRGQRFSMVVSSKIREIYLVESVSVSPIPSSSVPLASVSTPPANGNTGFAQEVGVMKLNPTEAQTINDININTILKALRHAKEA